MEGLVNATFTVPRNYLAELRNTEITGICSNTTTKTDQEHVYLIHIPFVFTAYLKAAKLLTTLPLQPASVRQVRRRNESIV